MQLSLGSLSDAFLNFQFSLKMYKRLNNNIGQASCLNNLGLIELKQEKYKNALNYFSEALEIKKHINDNYSLKQTLFNIGTSYYYLSEPDSAEKYLDQCLAIEKKLNDLHGISVTINSLGMIKLLNGETEKASLLFFESLAIARRIGDKENMLQNWNSLGIISLIDKKYGSAMAYFDSSLNEAVKLKMIGNLQDIYKNISSVLEKQEKYKEALESYRLFSIMAGQVINEQKRSINLENEYKLFELEKEKQRQKIVLVIIAAIIIFILIIIISIIINRHLIYKSQIERTLAEQEKLRFMAVIEASEQERIRIASDLHDSISYMLSIAKLNMSGLEDNLHKFPEVDQSLLCSSLNLIDDACSEIRNISHNMMPGSLTKLGLIAALKDLIFKVDKSNHLEIILESFGLEERLSEKIEIALFRIIQECINNIIKHAVATKTDIKINRLNGMLLVSISDNGKGFNKAILEQNSGIGWKNIYSRVGMINGKVELNSKTGIGTSINIQIPL